MAEHGPHGAIGVVHRQLYVDPLAVLDRLLGQFDQLPIEDLLEADDNWAKLSNDSLGFACWAYDFAYVKAISSSQPGDPEHDLKSVTDIVFTLEFEPEGAWGS